MPNKEPVSQAIDEFLALCLSQSIKHIVVAYSGGVDSLGLLHALHSAISSTEHDVSLSAVYVDHQLQAASSEWAKQNQRFCLSLGVQFNAVKVEVEQDSASLESAARWARYKALSQFVTDRQHCLVTGQHLNDQAETFLLQLLRGAGSKGLSAMPKWTSFANGYLARPLLEVKRSELEAYCSLYQLNAIEDPTNRDTTIRRNFVRHQVMPLLEQKWPQAAKVIAAASEIQAENQELLDELAVIDFEQCYGARQNSLRLEPVRQLTPQRIRNLLRYWLQRCGVKMPSQAVLQQIQTQMLQAKDDANPVIELTQGSLRRYRDALFWVSDSGRDFSQLELTWSAQADLEHDNQLLISLEWLKEHYPQLVGKDLIVKGRQGGERLRFKLGQPSVSLKNFFQEQGIPPWQRDQVLLIEWDGEIRGAYLPSDD